ncbi:MAG: DUF262 domain-containing protein [Euryarchaeota archaeon]|nr:DUF262 domain-containing protein [Euryarchaeota archaeon]
MESRVVSIGELLGDGNAYTVPELQRGYVWEGKHSMRLVRSINESISRDMELFLGPMIVYDGNGARKEILDGQQRITTIGIICRMLKDLDLEHINDEGDYRANQLKEFLKERPETGKIPRTKSEKYTALKKSLKDDYKLLKNVLEGPGGDHKLKHNTAPDDRNFAKIITSHTDMYGKVTAKIEAKKKFELASTAATQAMDEKNQWAGPRKNKPEAGDRWRILEDLKAEVKAKKKANKEAETPTEVEEAEKSLEEANKRLEEERNKQDAAIEARKKALVAEKEAKVEYEAAKGEAEPEWKERNGVKTSIEDSYRVLSNWIRRECSDLEKLQKFLNFLIHRVKVAEIELKKKDADQRHYVFKSLNSFGKELSASEKMKNDFLCMGSEVDREKRASDLWKEITEALKSIPWDRKGDVVSDFLWRYCQAQGITSPESDSGEEESNARDSTLKSRNTYAVFDCEGGLFDTKCKEEKEGSEEPVVDTDKLVSFMEELATWANGYAMVEDPTKLLSLGVSGEWVNEVCDIRANVPNTSRPYLLASVMKAFPKVEKNGGSPKIFHNLVKCMSTLIVRLKCSGEFAATKLETQMQEMTTMVTKSSRKEAFDNVRKQTREFFSDKLEINPDLSNQKWQRKADELFAKQLGEYNKMTNQEVKFILRGCERLGDWSSRRKKRSEFHDTKFYTTEHIIPISAGVARAFSRGEGDWYREHEEFGSFEDPSEEDDRLQPSELFTDSRLRLGNFILLEQSLNNKVSYRTWAGRKVKEEIPGIDDMKNDDLRKELKKRGMAISGNKQELVKRLQQPRLIKRGIKQGIREEIDVYDRPDWGKFHCYSHMEWQHDSETLRGSHLLSVKKFCEDNLERDYWGFREVRNRTDSLVKEAVKNKKWKLW